MRITKKFLPEKYLKIRNEIPNVNRIRNLIFYLRQEDSCFYKVSNNKYILQMERVNYDILFFTLKFRTLKC